MQLNICYAVLRKVAIHFCTCACAVQGCMYVSVQCHDTQQERLSSLLRGSMLPSFWHYLQVCLLDAAVQPQCHIAYRLVACCNIRCCYVFVHASQELQITPLNHLGNHPLVDCRRPCLQCSCWKGISGYADVRAGIQAWPLEWLMPIKSFFDTADSVLLPVAVGLAC